MSCLCSRLKRSNPLPPVTRLEDQSQTRRCAKLRRALSKGLGSLLLHTYRAYQDLRPLAVEVDLEKYYDIYEISRTDREETEYFTGDENSEPEDTETLKHFKLGLKKLHITRKLFLCGLLALEADGGKTDFARWSVAIETMNALSAETSVIAGTVDQLLRQEDGT